MKLRTVIFWPHLIAGVIAGVVILVMCVTGVLLTYERQMVAWSDRDFRSGVSPNATRLQPEEFLSRWAAAHPDLTPTGITVASAPDAPVIVAVPQRTLYADAYTAQLLGESSRTVRGFMSGVKSWHRTIAMTGDDRALGKAIAGWSNLVFAFIVASGIYLWLPRKWAWQSVKAVVLFKRNSTSKARDFNWHNVIGIWSSVPLFIVVVSAVPISFPWANALVYQAVGEPTPNQGREGGGGREGRGGGEGRAGGEGRGGREARAGAGGARRGGGNGGAEARSANQSEPRAEARAEGRGEAVSVAGLNALMARAERQVDGWRTINLRIPASPQAPAVFAIDRGDGGQPQHRSTLTLNRTTGDVVLYESFSDLTLGRRIRNVMRFAHTGEVLGIPGQTVAGLVSGGGAVLVWTGLALAWRRFFAWKRRRSTSTGRVATSPSTTAA